MKMTGWQTRLAFPVIPRDQWEFPTMPPEPIDAEDSPRAPSAGSSTSLSSVKGKEREVVVKLEEAHVRNLPPQEKQKSRAKPKPKSRAQKSKGQSSSASTATEAPPLPVVATAEQILNTNQTEDDELVYIKSEDMDMDMPTILPDPDDQNFYCRACNQQKHSRGSYRYHLKRVHKMQLTSLQPMPFPLKTANVRPELLPNVYDPDFYCRICKKKYKNAISYRRHCQSYHGILLNRIASVPDRNIEPDPDDPMHYCKACNRSYEIRATYRDHLRRVHKMVLKPVCNPANLDRAKGFICRFCNETFEEGKVYGAHLQANHQGKLEKR